MRSYVGQYFGYNCPLGPSYGPLEAHAGYISSRRVREKKYSATRWNYDRFMTRESANFGTPYKIHLRFFSKKSTRTRPGPPRTRPGPPRPAREHS